MASEVRSEEQLNGARMRIRVELAKRKQEIKQGWVARQIGLSAFELSNRLTGRTLLDNQTAEQIRVLLKMPLGWPWAGEYEQSPKTLTAAETPAHLRYMARRDQAILPLWRGVSAGLEAECVFVPDEDETIGVSAFLTGGEDARHIVCQASGPSMEPRIMHADYVVVRLDPNPPPNSIVVARDRGANQNYIKVLRTGSMGLELHSVNARFPAIVVTTEDWELIGYAVGIVSPNPEPGRNIEWLDGRALRVDSIAIFSK
jgi:SOS-response transcriptional repressor LexA